MAIGNIKPMVSEVRVGGANQVPVEVRPPAMALAMRWLKKPPRSAVKSMSFVANELMEATEGRRHENVTRFTAWPSQQGPSATSVSKRFNPTNEARRGRALLATETWVIYVPH
jgi:hypothetical protein